ncbi:MAG TPA: NAD(P)-dependent oxidoreductase [Rubrivivax sp.]|jgi:3-hydroxyisobutyrate dehydrogenase|nr:NAD(P)-dependent oxidoreductase [Betaproteobacteria bacterium]MBP6319480.1 NAD(P)-dependent oxidoreductase [Rubrivivax sp.]MBK7458609.1 NAD(P)-dependent oxidoreductase [Betaproteobacteria bacterium]MBK7515550.1 NAD(P)-dependent oxidoreductase [Betaproteobacteria bacterium]MBK8864700.1 NAD(P)-dependent oxidoreductase [Betaproteobacteria bacterium]
MKVTFFGTGLMGSGFVRRMRANGHQVNVWNRSAAKARALQDVGATAFDDPAAALAGAERLHLSLADDASVDTVLEPLAAVIAPGTWIVDHTTTAVTPTAERVARWRARGRGFVHAPVFMGPANALEGSGLMLLSCAQAQHDALLPALQQMTGKVVHVGEAPERAAAFKLFGNLTLIGIIGVLGDVNRLAAAVGISTQDAFSLFEHFNPGQTLPARAARIASADVTRPSFELAMARKDVRLMIEEARRGGFELPVTAGVAALFDAALSRGEGALDVVAAARIAT